MSAQNEIYLRRAQDTWQSRQDFAGMVTLLLGFLTFGAFVLFVCAPGHQSAGVMVGLMVLLLLSCVRLVSSAAKVVEIHKTLHPSQSNSEVIDAEVVDTDERRN
jgi:hypothetical protein